MRPIILDVRDGDEDHRVELTGLTDENEGYGRMLDHDEKTVRSFMAFDSTPPPCYAILERWKRNPLELLVNEGELSPQRLAGLAVKWADRATPALYSLEDATRHNVEEAFQQMERLYEEQPVVRAPQLRKTLGKLGDRLDKVRDQAMYNNDFTTSSAIGAVASLTAVIARMLDVMHGTALLTLNLEHWSPKRVAEQIQFNDESYELLAGNTGHVGDQVASAMTMRSDDYDDYDFLLSFRSEERRRQLEEVIAAIEKDRGRAKGLFGD